MKSTCLRMAVLLTAALFLFAILAACRESAKPSQSGDAAIPKIQSAPEAHEAPPAGEAPSGVPLQPDPIGVNIPHHDSFPPSRSEPQPTDEPQTESVPPVLGSPGHLPGLDPPEALPEPETPAESIPPEPNGKTPESGAAAPASSESSPIYYQPSESVYHDPGVDSQPESEGLDGVISLTPSVTSS